MEVANGVIGKYGAAAIVVIGGLILYWWMKWSARRAIPDDTFDTFFLAGGHVGRDLTGHNSWGLGFSFANAVWYFAYLGYTYGPWAFLLQIPWVLSVAGLAFLLKRYLVASREGTVHGFIGSRFGAKAAVVAGITTLIGYCLNVGFEMFYSAHLLTTMFNVEYIESIVAILIAVFVAAYCVAGGYLASVVTDKYQNLIGSGTLLLLIAAVSTLLLERGESLSAFSLSEPFSVPPWHFVLGVSVFAFFFNFVDMANWQSLSANRDLPERELFA